MMGTEQLAHYRSRLCCEEQLLVPEHGWAGMELAFVCREELRQHAAFGGILATYSGC